MKLLNRGLFLSIEGPDGSGKTTQINLLRRFLESHRIADFDVIFTREPGGTVIGEKIRDIILDNSHTEMSDLTEAMLYAAGRAQHVEQIIEPALSEGKLVICDRFIDSSIAYQGYGRGLGEKVSVINSIAVGTTMPYRTVFLDIDPQVAHNRISESLSFSERENAIRYEKHRTHLDRLELEKMEFHKKVYEGYKDLIYKSPERFVVVDGRGSIDQVQGRLRSSLVDICESFINGMTGNEK
ncbi:dTMP kinase [Anaerovoracaceae bacterium SGI.195]